MLLWLLTSLLLCGSALGEMETVEGLSFLAYAAGPVAAPAVIVVQEWWGVTAQIKAHAERISETGFRVLVPDLYKGVVGVDKEEASHLMGKLDFDLAVNQIAEAAQYLRDEGSPRIGITGFCMGGALALGGLAASEHITAAAPFYGINRPTMMAGSGKLNGLFDPERVVGKAVEGHFGALDTFEGFSDPATARELERALRAAGNEDATVHIYEGVGHAFMNDSPAPYGSFAEREEALGMTPYKEEVAELAWRRMLSFFSARLELSFLPRRPPAATGSECPKPPLSPPLPFPPRLPRLLKYDYETEALPKLTPFQATSPPSATQGARPHDGEDSASTTSPILALLGGSVAAGVVLSFAFGVRKAHRNWSRRDAARAISAQADAKMSR